MKEKKDLTEKQRKIIVRIGSIIFTLAMIGYAVTVGFKLKKGEKIGNGKAWIVIEDTDDHAKIKYKVNNDR